MAFSTSWQLLSPVQWAKWTWSAVRGGGPADPQRENDLGAADAGERSPAAGQEEDAEEETAAQAETKSLSLRQVGAARSCCRGPFHTFRQGRLESAPEGSRVSPEGALDGAGGACKRRGGFAPPGTSGDFGWPRSQTAAFSRIGLRVRRWLVKEKL